MPVLVDTALWVDHLHRGDQRLMALLEDAQVATHSMVVGELALGSLRDRAQVLGLIQDLPGVREASPDEVLAMVDGHRLLGAGLSLVDAHLLAAALLTPETALWTRDKRLHAVAAELGVARAARA